MVRFGSFQAPRKYFVSAMIPVALREVLSNTYRVEKCSFERFSLKISEGHFQNRNVRNVSRAIVAVAKTEDFRACLRIRLELFFLVLRYCTIFNVQA